MASKNAFVHGTGQLFLFPPKKLIIIGLDTDDVLGKHPLWRADAKAPPPDSLVDSIRRHGVLTPGRCRKVDDETAEVIFGRDRTKACRVLEAEGLDIKMPMLTWPKGTSLADIIGAVNAENSARKTDSLITQAHGVFMQMQAEGVGSGADELECAKKVSASTGMSVQRIRNLLAFREDDQLVRAVKLGEDGTVSVTLVKGVADEETKKLLGPRKLW